MAKIDTNPKATPKKKGGPVAPSKRTMNFVHHQSSINWTKVAIFGLVFLIAAGMFAKFGILDQLSRKSAAYNELAMQQEQLTLISTKLEGYEELSRQYGRYSYGWMNQTEVNMVSRMDVLKLVEKEIVPNAIIENMAVNNNVLTLNIRDITLADASTMVKSLEANDLVSSAIVYTAVAENAEEASIFISITLVKEAE